MKKTTLALVMVFLLLLSYGSAWAGVSGCFVSEEDNTYLFILDKAINANMKGVYIGSKYFLFSLNREDKADGTTRLFTSQYSSDYVMDITLRYEDDTKETALATGDIKSYNYDGTINQQQSYVGMQDVRFVRMEVPLMTELQGTKWYCNSVTTSGSSRNFPFDCRIIEFFNTEENTGQIPDNVDHTYPFTYTFTKDALILSIDVDGKIYKANVRIESYLLVVKIGNSTMIFLPEYIQI